MPPSDVKRPFGRRTGLDQSHCFGAVFAEAERVAFGQLELSDGQLGVGHPALSPVELPDFAPPGCYRVASFQGRSQAVLLTLEAGVIVRWDRCLRNVTVRGGIGGFFDLKAPGQNQILTAWHGGAEIGGFWGLMDDGKRAALLLTTATP